MNNRHLPAGQAMQGAGGPGPEMGPGTPGPRGGHRQRYNPQAYMPQHQHSVSHNMYPSGYGIGHPGHAYHGQYYNQHMNLYAQSPMGVHQQYIPYPTHQHHQSQYARSPPAHVIQHQPQQATSHQQPSHYAPIVTSGMGQPPYTRHSQPSPAIPPSYQPPNPPPQTFHPARHSRTPSSTTSAQAMASHISQSAMPPSQATPDKASVSPAPATPKPEVASSQFSAESLLEPAPITSSREDDGFITGEIEPFQPPLPWFSHPNEMFPKRIKKKRRRTLAPGDDAVALPPAGNGVSHTSEAKSKWEPIASKTAPPDATVLKAVKENFKPMAHEAPATCQKPPSESPTTPDTDKVLASQNAVATATLPAKLVIVHAPRVPAVPAVPLIPKKQAVQEITQKPQSQPASPAVSDHKPAEPVTAPVKLAPSKPKTWSGLFANDIAKPSFVYGSSENHISAKATDENAIHVVPGATLKKTGPTSLAEALRTYKVGGSEQQLSFVEPRGLINTGNMCYMNSVLQVLLFCVPFHDFLHQVYKKATHSFKSDTPLIDAMLMFMDEFNILASAESSGALRRCLRPENLEKYGEPFTPEFIYDVIKKLPRFASMRRGHQQDAEEFLGFLLESLHDECIHAMKPTGSDSSNSNPTSPTAHEAPDTNGWMEVGYRQKPTVTRSSGHPQIQTPITKIFGGQLRSELRVPGMKDSVTLEPYQPLQLDITANNIRNIVDALRGLTNPESLQGDFKSPRGKGVAATKQVFIDSLPPVLILHLKRFQFDAEGNGTIKVWKKIGYPLELEIPNEVLHRQKRSQTAPKYKLSAVVYHHGKNASGGHYSVDVRRQDGSEWIRIDDTIIRRIRSQDVAEGGVEENPKSPAWSDSRKDGTVGGTRNRFNGIGDEESGDDDGWKHVSAAANGKKWSNIINGAPSVAASAKKMSTDNIKDNKVAYLLFYQRI